MLYSNAQGTKAASAAAAAAAAAVGGHHHAAYGGANVPGPSSGMSHHHHHLHHIQTMGPSLGGRVPGLGMPSHHVGGPGVGGGGGGMPTMGVIPPEPDSPDYYGAYRDQMDDAVDEFMERLGARLAELELELRYAWRAVDVLSQDYGRIYEKLDRLEIVLYEQQNIIAQLLTIIDGGPGSGGPLSTTGTNADFAPYLSPQSSSSHYGTSSTQQQQQHRRSTAMRTTSSSTSSAAKQQQQPSSSLSATQGGASSAASSQSKKKGSSSTSILKDNASNNNASLLAQLEYLQNQRDFLYSEAAHRLSGLGLADVDDIEDVEGDDEEDIEDELIIERIEDERACQLFARQTFHEWLSQHSTSLRSVSLSSTHIHTYTIHTHLYTLHSLCVRSF